MKMLHQTIEKNIEPQSRSYIYLNIYLARYRILLWESIKHTIYRESSKNTRKIRAELCISHELIDWELTHSPDFEIVALSILYFGRKVVFLSIVSWFALILKLWLFGTLCANFLISRFSISWHRSIFQISRLWPFGTLHVSILYTHIHIHTQLNHEFDFESLAVIHSRVMIYYRKVRKETLNVREFNYAVVRRHCAFFRIKSKLFICIYDILFYDTRSKD